MKKTLVRLTAVSAAAALTIVPAMAAHAAPWDGSTVEVGHSSWDAESDYLNANDADLIGDGFDEYTDVLDTGLEAQISFDDWSSYDSLATNVDADLDRVVADNGDVTLTGTASNSVLADNNLSAVSEQRYYVEGDLFRHAVTYTNVGTEAITVDLGFYTDWGSSSSTVDGGGLRAFQNSATSSLDLPVDEDEDAMAALNDASAMWATHGDECDAPGTMAWGDAGAEYSATVSEMSGDSWYVHIDDVTIEPGASATVVAFILWDPDTLFAANYNNDDCVSADQITWADGVAANSVEFDTFSGRLNVGLENANVINWTSSAPIPTPTPTPVALASTGVDASAMTAAGAIALSLIAVAGLMLARRRAA
ncbi:MAG TPA: hypothetical protein VK139_05990 [Microbacteriaceae bacterium]|nr:hypothetical protein [Microbacteriaceae bacterium]